MLNKQKSVLILLLIFALAIFAYARRDALFQQAKKLIEQNLEKNLPCEFSIGNIRAGLFYGLVLEDLEMVFWPGQAGLPVKIQLDQALIDYNLWQNVFTGKQHKDKDMQTLRLKGGRISFGQSAPIVKNLQGRILLAQKNVYFQDIEANLGDNLHQALKFYGELSKDSLTLTANLEHLKIGNFDILTNLVLSLDKKVDRHSKLEKISGNLKTYGSVLNNRPIPELNSFFEIQDNKLRIPTFSLGEEYDLRGIVELSAPFNADLSLNFYQAALNELTSDFDLLQEQDFSGRLNGLIKISGDLSRPKVEGYLEAKDGHIGDLNFVSANINLKGRYPRILIVDSRICRDEDAFIVEGEIDFTNLQWQDFLNVKLKSDRGMFWQGWDITRKREDQVHLSKNIADDVKITFDSFMEGANAGLENNYKNELGLQYRISGNQLLKLRLRKEEEILGLERRIKF